jgi:putative intracellular protease/amidase
MSRKFLIVLSEWGYWGEELIGPLDAIQKRGDSFDFVTAKGKKPPALPPSMEVGFFDVPLDKVVTDEYYAKRTREVFESDLTDHPINLEEWFPMRPYFAQPNFAHKLEAYYNEREKKWEDLKQYDALIMAGGSGPMVDMVNNQRVHDLIFGFLNQGKLVVAECYAVAALAFAREWSDRDKAIIYGKHVTGHALEYDWKVGTGFAVSPLDFGTPFYPLELILRAAVGPDGQYHGGVGHTLSTILDYPFLTGRSTQDSALVGELTYKVLDEGLKRYGW